VGANIGYYSWLFKSWIPSSCIVLFEPDPLNANLIDCTLSRAGLHDVTLRRCAVSDSSGVQNFVTDEVSGFTGSLAVEHEPFALRHWRSKGKTALVRTVSLDDARLGQRQRVDLIKMDVEGHEEAALLGGREMIRHDRPVIVYECFHHASPITDFLNSLGYSIFDAERFSRDLNAATNFVALPENALPALRRLISRWEQEIVLANS
jgi:FkbM family methyltransferase